MSNQVHRKFEWELDESQNNDDIEESNKRLKRCVTHLQAELNHTVLMNQKAEIERSNESIKLNKMMTQEKGKVFDLQKLVGYDKQELYARSSILQKKFFETQSKLRVVAKAHEEIGLYLGKLVSEMNTWQFDHDQDIRVGDFVYFQCGYNNYPLGQVQEIKGRDEKLMYRIVRDDEAYEVSYKHAYKTDGKDKPDTPYPTLPDFLYSTPDKKPRLTE